MQRRIDRNVVKDIKNELNNNQLKIIPTKGLPMVTNWNLVWLKSKKLSPVAEAFLNHLKEQKDKIAEENFSWCLEY